MGAPSPSLSIFLRISQFLLDTMKITVLPTRELDFCENRYRICDFKLLCNFLNNRMFVLLSFSVFLLAAAVLLKVLNLITGCSKFSSTRAYLNLGTYIQLYY